MPRPRRCRRVGWVPEAVRFTPGDGLPGPPAEEIVLALDELEAMRLVDLEGRYQEQAAEEMGVSRQTLGRILELAHRKVAQFLVEGKSLRLEGGEVTMGEKRSFTCADCKHTWEVPFGTGRPEACPSCRSTNFHRTGSPCAGGPGFGGGRRRGGPPANR